jgi:hypothetical protein
MITDKVVGERPRWVREVAEKTGVSSSSIYRWRRVELIECQKVDHQICLLQSEFEAWLDRYLSRPSRRGPRTIRERQQQILLCKEVQD